MLELNKIYNMDNMEGLKLLEDNSIDSIVTDPPYGLGKEPNATDMLQAWINSGYLEINGSGFMGKKWDSFVPQPIFWKEVYKVLKPGGHILSFFGSRTYDWGVMAMRLAGFEIRDQIIWIYGSGFPKSSNIGKAVDTFRGNKKEVVGVERGTSYKHQSKINVEQGFRPSDYYDDNIGEFKITKGNSEWEGWGTNLKPAHELIVLARKPIKENTIVKNVLKYGTGGINIDECRIGLNGESAPTGSAKRIFKSNAYTDKKIYGDNKITPITGRFPANLLLECTCDELIKEGEDKLPYEYKNKEYNVKGFINNIKPNSPSNYNDKNKKIYHTNPDCPCYILDMQSGQLKSGDNNTRTQEGTFVEHGVLGHAGDVQVSYGDSGGASRFFYQAKVSKKERNEGLTHLEPKQMDESRKEGNPGGDNPRNRGVNKTNNFHPTVKPIALMRYLVKLITPKNGICLDPFMGSGTTGIACKLEKINFIGFELENDYFNIATERLKYYSEPEEKIIKDKKIIKKEINKNNNKFI